MSWISKMRRSRISVLVVCSFALFTDMVVCGVAMPIIPAILKNIGIPHDEINGHAAALFAIYAVGMLFATPIFGFYSDKYQNRKVPMLVGLFGLGITTVLFAFSDTYILLIIARLFQGISSAASWAIGFAMVADVFPSTQLGMANGILISAHSLGFVSGPLLGGFLASRFSLRIPFYVCGGLAFFDFIARLFISPPAQIYPTIPQIPGSYDDLWTKINNTEMIKLLKHGEVFLHAIAIVLGSCSFSIVEALLALHLELDFGWSISDVSIGLTFLVTPTIVSSVIVGWISDHITRTRIVMIGLILHSLASPLLASAQTPSSIYLASTYFSTTYSIYAAPIMAFVTSIAKELGHGSSLATLYSISNMSYCLGMILGPLLGGYIVEGYSYFTASFFAPIGFWLFFPFYTYYTLKMERKRNGLEWTRKQVWKNMAHDLVYPHTIKPGVNKADIEP